MSKRHGPSPAKAPREQTAARPVFRAMLTWDPQQPLQTQLRAVEGQIKPVELVAILQQLQTQVLINMGRGLEREALANAKSPPPEKKK